MPCTSVAYSGVGVLRSARVQLVVRRGELRVLAPEKLQEVRARAALQVQHVRADEVRAVVGDGADRRFD